MVCTAQTCSGRSLHILEEQILIRWNVLMRRCLDWERGGASLSMRGVARKKRYNILKETQDSAAAYIRPEARGWDRLCVHFCRLQQTSSWRASVCVSSVQTNRDASDMRSALKGLLQCLCSIISDLWSHMPWAAQGVPQDGQDGQEQAGKS